MKKPYAGRKKDQARQQHAEAEAGRRNRDFTAFKALAEVVPGLDGNRTKADQACYALSWLERMIADNEQMESELADHDVMDDFLTRSEESSVFSEFTVEE